jgi:hypothetical protein
MIRLCSTQGLTMLEKGTWTKYLNYWLVCGQWTKRIEDIHVMGWILPPEKEVWNSKDFGIHPHLEMGLHSSNQVKMKLSEWTLIRYHYIGLTKRGNLNTEADMHRKEMVWRHTGGDGHVAGMVHLQTKEARRRQGRILSLWDSEGACLPNTLILDFYFPSMNTLHLLDWTSIARILSTNVLVYSFCCS